MDRLINTCNLSVEDRNAVLAEYAAAAHFYQATIRLDGNRAHVALRGDRDRLRRLLDRMVAQESSCCPFIHFDRALALDGYEVNLSISNNADDTERSRLLRHAVRGFFPNATVVGG